MEKHDKAAQIGSGSGVSEIDIIDVIKFVQSGWKVIVLASVFGGLSGVLLAFVLPEKYLAEAKMVGGKVFGEDLESPIVFIDRVQNPSIYSNETLSECGITSDEDQSPSLKTVIKYEFKRDSPVVGISTLLPSPETARNCLSAVLRDVQKSQEPIFDTQYNSRTTLLAQLEKELADLKERKQVELSIYSQELAETKMRLKTVQLFLDRVDVDRTTFDVSDDKFSAATLRVATILQKQIEASELRVKISDLDTKIQNNTVSAVIEDQIAKTQREINDMKSKLMIPNTQKANFVGPVFSQDQKAQPRRTTIVFAGIFLGGLLGLFILFIGWLRVKVKEREFSL